MTHTDDVDMNDWLGALRNDVEPAPHEARARISARLAGAGVALVLASGAVAAAATTQRAWFHSAWFGMVMGLPVGITLGAAGHAWLHPPPAAVASPRTVPVATPSVATPPVPAVAVEELPQEAEPALPVLKARRVESAPEQPSLERELLLLEQARTRLAEGQPSATLELLRKHRGAYPTSALEQEREALTIRALVAGGKHGEARRRADAFAELYPTSVLRPSVERAVGKIP
jgi:hypothetical protein